MKLRGSGRVQLAVTWGSSNSAARLRASNAIREPLWLTLASLYYGTLFCAMYLWARTTGRKILADADIDSFM